jgi:hypothetical protein
VNKFSDIYPLHQFCFSLLRFQYLFILPFFFHIYLLFNPTLAAELATSMNRSISEVKQAMKIVHDENPGIGLRGCRITAVFPFLTEMQIRAVISATIDLMQLDNPPKLGPLKIAVPMLSSDHELSTTLNLIRHTAKQVEFLVLLPTHIVLKTTFSSMSMKNVSNI